MTKTNGQAIGEWLFLLGTILLIGYVLSLFFNPIDPIGLSKTHPHSVPATENVPIHWVKKFSNGTGTYILINQTTGVYARELP
jgi:hypothetical protein